MNCFFTFQLQMTPKENWRVENRTKLTCARIVCCARKGCLTSPSGVSPCLPARKDHSLTAYDLPSAWGRSRDRLHFRPRFRELKFSYRRQERTSTFLLLWVAALSEFCGSDYSFVLSRSLQSSGFAQTWEAVESHRYFLIQKGQNLKTRSWSLMGGGRTRWGWAWGRGGHNS